VSFSVRASRSIRAITAARAPVSASISQSVSTILTRGIPDIHNLFPTWNIDPSLTEYDQIWNGVTAETNAAQDARSKIVLDSIFSSDDHTWISITSHSGEIGSILRVLGHQSFSLSTGAVIPVLVKAEF